jgi:hypothetical protein
MQDHSFGLLGEIDHHNGDVIVNLPLLPLRLQPDLPHRRLDLLRRLLQTLVDQHVGHLADGVLPHHLRHLLPAQLVPQPVRSNHHRPMLLAEVERLHLGDSSDVVAGEVLEGRLELHFGWVVFRVVELGVLEPEVADRAGGLQAPLDVTGLIVVLLAHHHVFLVGEEGAQTLLLLGVVGVELSVELGEAHWYVVVHQNSQGIASVTAVESVIINHADKRTRACSSSPSKSCINAHLPYL